MGKLSYGERKRRLLEIIKDEMTDAHWNTLSNIDWTDARKPALEEIARAIDLLFPPEEASK